jgi:cyclin H
LDRGGLYAQNEKSQILSFIGTDFEGKLVRYYCEKTLELGEAYKPPIPTMVRVR